MRNVLMYTSHVGLGGINDMINIEYSNALDYNIVKAKKELTIIEL